MLPAEKEPSFAYIGLVHDYNGIQVEQSSYFLSITLAKYIDHVLTTHAWDKAVPHEASSGYKADVVLSLFKKQGLLEETPEHASLAEKQNFDIISSCSKTQFTTATSLL